jgi:probable HAF family extracellular repeat protein
MTRFNQRRVGGIRQRQAFGRRPLRVEQLEDRYLLSYTITDLGTLGGPTSVAYAINAHGIIVGAADTDSSGHAHAFLYDTSIHDLGTLSGGTTSAARAINDNTPNPDVAGDSDTLVSANNTHYTHAFLKPGGQIMQDLGTLPDVSQNEGNSTAMGINNAGKVVGKSNDSDLPADGYYGFYYDGSTMDPLDPLKGKYDTTHSQYSPSYANAIDNESTPVIVGASKGFYDSSCTSSPNYNNAYSWIGTTSQKTVGSLDGEEAHAFAINSGGIVVGDSSVGNPCKATPTPHAFVAVPNTLVPPYYTLTQLDANAGSWITQSRAFGINGNATSYTIIGQYGYTIPSSGELTDSFIYDSTSGSLADLAASLPANSGWSKLLAFAINSSGDIVGQGKYTDPVTGNSYFHAFLMTPPGTSPGPSGHSGPPPLADPNTSQGSAANAVALSGVPANAPLSASELNFPAALTSEQESAAGMTGSTATAATSVPLLLAPSTADSLFAAPSLEWTGDLAGGALG